MRKLSTVFKSLLVAAGLCMGANAWADVTPVTQDYESDGVVADWTSGNTDRYTVSIKTADTNHYLGVDAVSNGGNGTSITGATINGKVSAGTDFASSDDFTLIFDLQLNGGNNQSSWFHINDASNSNGGDEAVGTHMLTLYQAAANGTTWEINGAKDKTVTLAKSTWFTFKLCKSGKFLYLTVINTSTSAEILAQTKIAVNSTVGGLGQFKFATKRYYAGLSIDNVVLRTLQPGDVPVGTATTYTIKYRNESDVEIKSDIVTDAMVDDVVTASAAQMADIVYSAQKYIYKSGNENKTLVADAASNVITLVYREANSYTYKVTSSLGTVLVNSSGAENDVVNVPYPKYELSNYVLYQAGTSTEWYRKNYTLTSNIDETISYSSAVNNVVFYIEGENITGATVSTANNALIRNSNAAVGYAAGTAGEDDLTITTLPAGSYRIVANVHTSSSGGGTSTFKLGANTFAAEGNKSQYNTEKTSDVFTITGNTDLVLQAGGAANNAVDYVYVIQTALPATIASSGYSTIASDYALDCANLPSGLKAYKVSSISASAATLEEVTEAVAAGTGLILEGTASTAYDIPVVATGTDISATNKLKAAVTATAIAADEAYILLGGEFHKVTAASEVPAGKAYLLASDVPASARELSFVFADETNAIHNAQFTMHNEAGIVYNLNGQRVDNAQLKKGLYIVNGKKVIKN